MSWLQRIIIVIVLYVAVGVTLGIIRHGNGRGGWESFFAMIFYPALWPHYEYLRLEKRWDEQRRTENERKRLLAEVCPPEFHSLLYSHLLDGKGLPAYRKIRDAVAANPPVPGDKRSGFVLFKLSEAAAKAGSAGVLNDASRLLTTPEAGAGHFTAAAAIAHGVFLHGQTASAGKGEEERIAALKVMLIAYERALPFLSEADQAHVDLGMGTLYQAACQLLPKEETAGMRDKARAAYLRAAASGKVAASFPAALHAAGLAENYTERKMILAQFLNAIDFEGRSWQQAPLPSFHWSVTVRTQRRAQATAGLILGKSLLPAFDSGMDNAMLKVVELDDWDRGIRHGWGDFMFLFVQTVDDFPTRTEMLADILARLLPPDADIVRDILGREEVTCHWDAYYRLYEKTKDERWLEAASATLYALRPALRKFEHLFAAEAAYMRGEYRRHCLSVARHIVSPSSTSTDDVSRFTSKYMERLMRGKRVNTPWGYQYWFNLNLFAGQLERRRNDGAERRAMAEKIERDEWPTDSYEVVDSDVAEIPEGERN